MHLDEFRLRARLARRDDPEVFSDLLHKIAPHSSRFFTKAKKQKIPLCRGLIVTCFRAPLACSAKVVPFSLKTLIDRYVGRRASLPSMDMLASLASPGLPLEERLNWLVDVVQWIRRPGPAEDPHPSGVSLQSGRLRRFLDVLDRNPEWKLAVARTLRSIMRETRAVALFSETGLPRQFGLLTEIGERLGRRFLPHQPGSAELGVLFDRLFPYRNDHIWIGNLDEATLERFGAMLDHGATPEERGWNTLAEELEDALAYLAAQIRVTGCSEAIRRRLRHQSVRELAYFKLGTALSAIFAAREKGDQTALSADLDYLKSLIDACNRSRSEALKHLEKSGVSTEIVYHLAFIEASLERFRALLELAFDPAAKLKRRAAFVALLAQQNRARESVIKLLRQNWRLLTRKMVERSGQTGEHYIARTRLEYSAMLQSAAGGGAIMAVTAWVKTIILGWGLPDLMQGIAASLNYSAGFVAIQLTGSTLATKQPANTAASLAARMHNVRDAQAFEQLVDEIVFLVRSQIASIAGNLALVVPSMLLLHFLILGWTGRLIIPPEQAIVVIHSVSILGASPIYAAFTGALLWASSLVAAWADNWFAYHHIGEALATDRRLIRTLGTTRAGRLTRFCTRNIAGLSGNISFGFMLGLIPELAQFAGIPLDIRHVTLSACFLTASVATLGMRVLATKAFALAVLGIAGIGAMNLTVSFWLAMFVATRACDIQAPERRAIYFAVARRAIRRPLTFLFPTPS